MSAQLAKQMNVNISDDGMVVTSGIEESSTTPLLIEDSLRRRTSSSTTSNRNTSLAVPEDIDEQIYIKPKRRKNICEQIVDYFWSY
jgi:hypothetical protein